MLLINELSFTQIELAGTQVIWIFMDNRKILIRCPYTFLGTLYEKKMSWSELMYTLILDLFVVNVLARDEWAFDVFLHCRLGCIGRIFAWTWFSVSTWSIPMCTIISWTLQTGRDNLQDLTTTNSNSDIRSGVNKKRSRGPRLNQLDVFWIIHRQPVEY